jgi:hypothetical protein
MPVFNLSLPFHVPFTISRQGTVLARYLTVLRAVIMTGALIAHAIALNPSTTAGRPQAPFPRTRRDLDVLAAGGRPA